MMMEQILLMEGRSPDPRGLLEEWRPHAIGLSMVWLMIWILVVPTMAESASHAFPPTMDPRSNQIVDQDGQPVFFSGDTAWSLLVQVSLEDAIHYLDDRANKGFNLIIVNLLEHHFADNAPRNFYGNTPFLGKAFEEPSDLYFEHVDNVLLEAAQRGIVVMLFPLYLGYDCGEEGWCGEVKDSSLTQMRDWGRYVGTRYRDQDNIIWSLGGDTDPGPVESRVMACAQGVRERDDRHLFTVHVQSETMGVTPWSDASWIDINTVYSWRKRLYRDCQEAYELVPTTPYFMIEGRYENSPDLSDQQLLSQMYWPVLCGAGGCVFGNSPVWYFGARGVKLDLTFDWKSQLDSPGASWMKIMRALFMSRAWDQLIPDFSHEIMVGGWGILVTEERAVAARTQDGGTFIAYLPSQREVFVEMSKVSGQESLCWWFDPERGESFKIGVVNNTGVQRFVPPEEGAWVLVIDDRSLGLSAPGSDLR